MEGFTVCSNIG